jgi:hypothetical protein
MLFPPGKGLKISNFCVVLPADVPQVTGGNPQARNPDD